jgi:hypothetical protein
MTTSLDAGEAPQPAEAKVEAKAATEASAEPKPKADTAPAQEGDTGKKGGRVWTWVMVGAGAAIVAGGAITGGISMGKEKDLKADCNGTQCPESRKGDADTIRTMNLTADILYGVGAAAIVTGIVLFFVEPKHNEATTVALVPSGDGFVLAAGGRF